MRVATELIIIARLHNQASAQLRRLAGDVRNLGRADALQRNLEASQMRTLQQQARLAATGGRLRESQLRQTERALQLDKDLHTNMTNRMRLNQRLANTADPNRRIILERMIEGTYQRQDVLQARRALMNAQEVNQRKAITAQLRIQEAQYKRMLADQAAMVRLQQAQAAQAPFQRAGRVARTAGRTATYGGLLATAGFGVAANQFAEFDRLTIKAATQTDQAERNVASMIAVGRRLQDEILKQMMKFPATANEMAEASYEIFSSMDVGEEQGYKYLRMFNRLAVAMGSDLATATDVGITVLNNFGEAVRRPERALDLMATIVRFGRMELADFNSMMNKVAPAAAGAGLSLEQVGGAMAALTRLMPSQDQAATSLARLIQVFNNRDFQAGMAKAGRPITNAEGRLLAPLKIIKQIIALDPDLRRGGRSLQNFIQTITAFGRGDGSRGIQSTEQARRGLVLLVKNADLYEALQRKMSANQGELNKRLQAMNQSFGVRWQVFINQLRVLVLEIGEAAIPAFMSLMSWIQRLRDRWNELEPSTRQAIIRFTAFAAIIGLIGGPILGLIGIITGLIGVIRFLGVSLGGGAGGTVGRLAMLFGILRRLSAIGIITITVAVIFRTTGLGNWVDEQLGNLEEKLKGQAGYARVLRPLISGLRGLDEATGFSDPAEGGLFNPDAQLFTPQQRRNMQDMGKQLDNVRNKMKDKGDRSFLDKLRREINRVTRETTGDAKLREIERIVGESLDPERQQRKQDIEELKQWKDQRADIIKQAHEEHKRIMEQAVNNMVAKYNELRDANASAMGQLFQGPVLTGESFKLAEEWGVTPSIEIINKDLRGQINQFNAWKADLRAVARRGAPKELVQELLELGPDAADKIEVLRRASPKMFNNFVRLWRQRNAQIERETRQDFNDQLKIWEAHGKNMGLKIIAGLESEQTALRSTMEGILRNSFNGNLLNQIVSDAIAEFESEHPMPTVTRAGGGNRRDRNRRNRRDRDRRTPRVPVNVGAGLGVIPGVGGAEIVPRQNPPGTHRGDPPDSPRGRGGDMLRRAAPIEVTVNMKGQETTAQQARRAGWLIASELQRT